MRISPREVLFPGVRGRILEALFLDPSRAWYLGDLARSLRLAPSSLQRDLARLAAAGIVRRHRDGNRVYFEPDPTCPFLAELAVFLAKTTGLLPRLRAALEPLSPQIHVAFVYGSTARGEDAAASDVDLFVVGDVSLLAISSALQALRAELGRPIHPVVYAPAELARRGAEREGFLHRVLGGDKAFVVGGENELERARRGAPSDRGGAEPRRAGRPASARRGRAR